jgi:hypothetical protein
MRTFSNATHFMGKGKIVRTGLCVFTAGLILSINGCHTGSSHSGPQTGENKPWSFIQIGDLHAGSGLSGPSWTNTLNTILASNQLWNLKLVISPGDCYEQDTNLAKWTDASPFFPIGGNTETNGMWRIKKAGISWMNVPGNHDSDVDEADPTLPHMIHWNNVFGTNFYATDPHWFSNRVAGDTRDLAFRFTNGTAKVMFVGLRWLDNHVNPPDIKFATTNEVFTAYSTNCAWASNLARAYPDYLIVPVMHYFMDTNGTPNTKDIPSDPNDQNGPHVSYVNEGPGVVCWDALKSAPNLMMILSGHVRARPMVRSSLRCDDGHMVDSILFNTQTAPTIGTNTIANGGCFVLYTVYPAQHYVRGRVFEADWGRFLTNGEFSSLGFVNDWTFPFKKLP